MGILAYPVFSRFGAEASFWRSLQTPTSPTVADEGDLHTLEWELRAALELVRPGFMALSAMRHGERIVDFVWSFASTAAGRILGRNALDLYGKRLRVVLAREDGCEAVFEQYRHVVEQGAASATQVHQIHDRHDTYRHGAVRVGDGVAVTLINVSAAHRAHALGLALHAQQATRFDELSRINWKSI
jgi:PAS domain-containing protein